MRAGACIRGREEGVWRTQAKLGLRRIHSGRSLPRGAGDQTGFNNSISNHSNSAESGWSRIIRFFSGGISIGKACSPKDARNLLTIA